MNDVLGSFTVRQFGHIGQEILDQDGSTIAWMTDAWLAHVICKLLTDNEALLRNERKESTNERTCHDKDDTAGMAPTAPYDCNLPTRWPAIPGPAARHGFTGCRRMLYDDARGEAVLEGNWSKEEVQAGQSVD